ncbi:response regulator [bacterium]|nr:response regulator [bacterium]
MKIMIVDDNALMRKQIMQTVVRADDIIMECTDGESALANCLDFNPDWFLLDIRMEKINGLERMSR